MMPEERPNPAPSAHRSSPARPAGRNRLATIRADFFLDPAARLTEQERALMTTMLHSLLGDLADELRAALPNPSAAANDESNLDVVDALISTRLLDDPTLMALLLRRADEERIVAAAESRRGRHDARVLQGLVSHDNGAVSAAAMALILARGRRRDRFGQCLIAFDDLPQSCAVDLVHAVAAVLRHDLAAVRGPTVADRELGEASRQVLAGYDAACGTDALTADLVRLLDEEGQLNDELILAAAHQGEVAFIAEVLGRRAGLPGTIAADELLSASPEKVVALFRMADLPRALVAGLLAGIGDLLGVGDAGDAIGIFDRLTDEQIAAKRTWLTTAPAYRRALAALETDHGQRTL